ncbi:hypothetical protein [Desulforegula conservatrix]|uniref:hypothetical protein n=1 Tax=Desulforegula conservatrix TaxID=153026 RepID=UPI000488AEEF|nr:hypothetical protein [Desulforegula conservatrix]
MRIAKSVLMLLLFCMTSCATAPPAIIRDGIYYNDNYGFSFKTPEGWHNTNKMPEWLKKGVSGWVVLRTQYMCFNNETNGFIEVSCVKSYRSMDGIRKFLEDAFQDQKKEMQADPYFKKINCKYYTPKEAPLANLVEREELYYENEFVKERLEQNTFVYSFNARVNYILTFTFISRNQTFEENRKAYDSVLKSFQTYKVDP